VVGMRNSNVDRLLDHPSPTRGNANVWQVLAGTAAVQWVQETTQWVMRKTLVFLRSPHPHPSFIIPSLSISVHLVNKLAACGGHPVPVHR
jgi:hypothetical protein